MDLYFSPMACSLASRIALYEAGAADVRFIEVDPKSKHTLDGADYREIYPLGLVPLLRLDDGSLLSENAAILQYIASRYPDAKLAPVDESWPRAPAAMAVLHRHRVAQGVFHPAVRSRMPRKGRVRTRSSDMSRG